MNKVKIEELRIDNWVIHPTEADPIQVKYLCRQKARDGDYDAVGFCRQLPSLMHDSVPVGYIQGIPLSPEVLAKCGFQKEEDEWWRTWHGQFREELWLCELENGSFALSHDHYFTLHEGVSSVHMLQNAFWIVTGQELSFTP